MDDRTIVDDFLKRAGIIADTHDKDKAFDIISNEVNACDDRLLNEFITALNLVRNERTLDWIEKNIHRTSNIGVNWGHLAASSLFNWRRADKWLETGRPLSLVALDALSFCTSVDERLNQSLWMKEIKPRLHDTPRPEEIARRLNEYLLIDKAHRTRVTVERIISNLFDVRA